MIHSDISTKLILTTNELKENLKQQSESRKELSCLNIPYNQFMVSGDFRIGNTMLINVAKIALDLFDSTCNRYIDKMTLGNIESIINKIQYNYNKINEKLKIFEININTEYLKLKIQQCNLQEDILFNKQRQKELEKTEREILKEQLREEKQLQREQEKLEQEKVSLQYKFNKELEQKGIKNGDLEREITNIESEIAKHEYALTHKRAGYVYVVSNNDMKEGQYKIGITRRTVEERMKELGAGASHSFGMNVHGYVYCDDCFKVETMLHKHFAAQRVNQVNPKKEWFYTSLEDIQQAFKDLFDIDIILTDISDENYLYSKDKIKI